MKQIFTSIIVLFFIHEASAQTPAIKWQKSLGGNGGETLYKMKKTSDGGYILAGSADANNGDVTGNHGGLDC